VERRGNGWRPTDRKGRIEARHRDTSLSLEVTQLLWDHSGGSAAVGTDCHWRYLNPEMRARIAELHRRLRDVDLPDPS
jgi:hypothetical protein